MVDTDIHNLARDINIGTPGGRQIQVSKIKVDDAFPVADPHVYGVLFVDELGVIRVSAG